MSVDQANTASYLDVEHLDKRVIRIKRYEMETALHAPSVVVRVGEGFTSPSNRFKRGNLYITLSVSAKTVL